MKETEYTYAVAYIKTLENRMLTTHEIQALLLADGFESSLKLLTDKGFGKDLSGNETVDEILKSELEGAWTEAKNVCPEEAPLEILMYKNDFHNLKTILKAIVSGAQWENLILKPCITEPKKILEAVKSVNFADLPEFLSEAAKNAYKLITETNDGQLTEVYLDKECLIEMKKRADKEKSEFLSGWIDLNILIANLKTAVRAVGKNKDFISDAIINSEIINAQRLIDAALVSRDAVIDEISSLGYPDASEKIKESMSSFEKWCDNKKVEYIKKAKLKSFGFEPILAFLVGKEFELQAVRIILSGKQNKIPTEIINERLRDLYV